MRILFKASVRIQELTPALTWMFYVLDSFARHSGATYLPSELTITSIYDGKHQSDSRHYRGEALDIRSKNFSTATGKAAFRRELENALNTHPLAVAQGLGNLFRVLTESLGTDSEHFHVQVRKGKTFPGT